VNTDAHLECIRAATVRERSLHRLLTVGALQCLDNLQPCPYRTPRIIFMRFGVKENTDLCTNKIRSVLPQRVKMRETALLAE
jgi:hypothetical protein